MSALVPIWSETRDGEPVVIRPMRAVDARSVLAVQRAIVAAGDGVMMTPDDLDDDAFVIRALASAARRDPRRGVRLVAEVAGRLAATASIARLRPSLCRHVASVSVGVDPAFQGAGLGRQLVERALEWTAGPGRAAPTVTRVELSVRADNARAITLYRSMGFAVEATRSGTVRTPEGAFIDDHVMVWSPDQRVEPTERRRRITT